MPKFQYRALDDSGQMRVGTIEAASRAAVLPELEKLAFFPVDVSDMREPSRSWRQMFARAPTKEEITGVTQDLATLIKGGVTLDRALLILSETSARPSIAKLLLELHSGISAGNSWPRSCRASGHLSQDLRQDGRGGGGCRDAGRDVEGNSP
jgi:general secretion pathway protein F